MILVRMHQSLLESIHIDLGRKHAFAAERVGFIKARCAQLPNGGTLILGEGYLPLEDMHYKLNPLAGATMNSDGIRAALQVSYGEKCSMLHVHRHEHHGHPGFSSIDLRENEKFVPNFFNVTPSMPHGAIVLSHDSYFGYIWLGQDQKPRQVDQFSITGNRIRDTWWSKK
jgi:hypothetical protein